MRRWPWVHHLGHGLCRRLTNHDTEGRSHAVSYTVFSPRDLISVYSLPASIYQVLAFRSLGEPSLGSHQASSCRPPSFFWRLGPWSSVHVAESAGYRRRNRWPTGFGSMRGSEARIGRLSWLADSECAHQCSPGINRPSSVPASTRPTHLPLILVDRPSHV